MVSGPGPAVRVLGGELVADAQRLAAAVRPGTALLVVGGRAADPRTAGEVTDTVVGLLDALQGLSAQAADQERSADIVVAVVTPVGAHPVHAVWRRALDEAISGVTQSLSREYVPDVLRVNAVLGSAEDLDDLVATVEFCSHADGAFAVGATVEVRS